MENKKVLGKIIPAVLVLVLALLLVITISSCSKGKKTPVGAIEDKKDYLKIDIADNESYTVSKLEFYNKLRYAGYDVFEDALYEAALYDTVKAIKDDIEANSANLQNATYYNRFKYIIDAEAYGTTDEDEIEDLDDDDKEKKEKTYLNNLEKLGYTVDENGGIYQKASFEYQTIKLAKREYARSVLLKEIDEEDSENKVTTKKIEDFFSKKIVNRGDFSALIILFSSQTEIEDSLKQLNLKFIGSKLYRVPAKDATYADDANRTFAEYEEYYNDFDGTKDTDAALSNNEVLFELCRMYNYIYSYRPQLTFKIDGVDYLAKDVNPTADTYTTEDYVKIKSMSLEDMTAMLLAQDEGDDESPRLNYDYDTIYDIDSTLQTAMYQKYLANSIKQDVYNTPSSTFARGNYLSFKLVDADELTYKSCKDLVKLLEAVETSADDKTISAHIETIKEDYTDRLKAMGIYSNDTEVKNWAISYANNIKAFGKIGAKEILMSTEDKDSINSIWSKVFEEMLTDDYINEKLKEYLDDECKITIYDQLFEAQFAQNYEDIYKAGNKTSKANVLKVKVNGVEHVITAEDLFNRLEMRHGAGTAANLLLSQIIKEKYYDKVITDAKKKEYEKEYESSLTYFAQGQSSQYGYNPSIGQKAFMNLYFQAETKEEAIFNMWVSRELQDTLIYKNPKDINSSILDAFSTLTNLQASNYTNIEYNLIYAYTDDDEDGEADDWTLVDDTDPVKYARKQEVMQLSAELFNIINERAMTEYANSDRDGAYNSLHSKYQAASRISMKGNAGDGDSIPAEGFKTTSEQDAFYFAKYKAKGIFLALNVDNAINTLQALKDLKDENYIEQVKRMYNYMISEHSSDLTVDQIFARKLVEEDTYADVDKATAANVFEYEKGYATFYVYQCKEAPVFKFEEKDNSDTSTGSKVYPYSIDEDDPFPVDEDGKPIDNSSDTEHTLYNSNDEVSINQLIIYIRESKDGVESLSMDVIEAFNAYFEEDIMKKYTSDTFKFYIANALIKQYEAEGKITIDENLRKSIDTLVKSYQKSLFDFEENAFTKKWAELFN